MWKNREPGLENIGQELPRLREKLERMLPAYVASLQRVSGMPVELGRRWRASWVAEHLEKVRQSYQQLVNQGMVAGLFGGMVSNLMSTITRQPALAQNPAASWQFAVSILPTGEAKPTLTGMSPRQAEAIVVSFEEFERAALELEKKILSGRLVPERQDQIPSLIYAHLDTGRAAS
jgi:hypothetical protein